MRRGQPLYWQVCVFASLVLGARGYADEPEGGSPLTLADLADYRKAFTGDATVDVAKPGEPAIEVSFKDLWETTSLSRGRRVIIKGRVERIFRQGPVGAFPALAEIWLMSPAGDPFCLVAPQLDIPRNTSATSHGDTRLVTMNKSPELGQAIQFTGTFLRMVRYAASDGARLAPLVVGNCASVSVAGVNQTAIDESFYLDQITNRKRLGPESAKIKIHSLDTVLFCVLILSLVIGVLIWPSLRVRASVVGCNRLRKSRTPVVADPPLEFIADRYQM
jgi:hypothetical protein